MISPGNAPPRFRRQVRPQAPQVGVTRKNLYGTSVVSSDLSNLLRPAIQQAHDKGGQRSEALLMGG